MMRKWQIAPVTRSSGSVWGPRIRWFAAEITVVVAGVLIALALNAWWQGREQRQEQERLLVALLDEFESNRARLAEIVAFHEALKATTRTLLAISAERASELPTDSIDRLLADVTWWSSYTTLSSTVVDAAVQDGRLDLIRTDSLRQLLAAWRSEVASAEAQRAQEYSHYAGTWLPLLRAETDLAQIANRAQLVPGTGDAYQGQPIPLTPSRTDHGPVVATRGFRNALVQKLWIEDDVLYQYGKLGPLLARIIDALRREEALRGV